MSIGRKVLDAACRELAAIIKPHVVRLLGQSFGFTLFVFEYGTNKTIGYISSADRAGMIETVKVWLAKQEAGLYTDPSGPRAEG